MPSAATGTPDVLDANETHALATHATLPVLRIRGGVAVRETLADTLAEETPVALEYNGISHATLLATPADLEDFALGFSLTEGIVDSLQDVRDVGLREEGGGVVVALEVSSASFARLKDRRRAMAGRTGCGLCGVETLPEVLRPVRPVPAGQPIALDAVRAAQRDMRARQALHEITGATHAAAWADAQGNVRLVREDVGRHNALDKLVGGLARAGMVAGEGFIVVSSRASFEMVQKAAWSGAPLLAAVSAPTALATRLADDAGLTLIGFLRDADCTVYAHPERVRLAP